MNSPDRTPADREEQLGEIISRWLESREAGQPPDREVLLTKYPEFAEELAEFLDEEERLRRLAAPLRRVAQEARVDTPLPWSTTISTGLSEDESSPTAIGEYELLEEIGRGGMAVVYRARQKGLARFVALKLFRADCLGRTSDLQRFRHEAEIIAHLDHPQIVPVYDVGEDGGRGFFTMKLMEGGGLDAHLSSFISNPVAAAKLVASIARAIHHAHQRGILHRDLKPSNILLAGSSNTTLAEYVPHVSDFGLAKRVGSELDLTRTGAVVGTPTYMAPEQAAGANHAITTATDVYGLGTVLYALLTGRPPFVAGSVLDVLYQVKEIDPDPPRRINPRVSRDLETICLKCLHKDPRRRYESASAVAEDLERWLRGEPIVARPIGRLGRLWRWSRRQPVQASLALALLLAVLTGFGLVFWQWRRAETNLATANTLRQEAETNLATMTTLRQNAETLRQEAVDSKNEATTNFHLAHQAVREITNLLEESGQLEAHGLDPLHREVLRRAQFYFERFLEHRSQDPKLRLDHAQAAATLADIIRQTGSPLEALKAYQRAISLAEELQKDDPDSVRVNLALAMLHNQNASVHDALGHRDEAIASLKRANAIMEMALAKHPQDRSLQSELASTQHNLGRNYAAINRIDDALASYNESRTMFEKLHKLQPDNVDTQRLLANTLNSIGMAQGQQGRWNEAVQTFQKAVELSDALAKRYPQKRLLQYAVAQQLSNLGDALARSGQLKKALEPLERARGISEELVRTSPAITDFHVTLGLCHAVLAQVQIKLGEPGRGCESFETARTIFRRLVKAHPQVIDYRRRLIDILIDLAGTRSRMHQRDQALDAYREGRDVAGWLVDNHPDEPDFLGWLGVILNNRALAEAEMVSLVDARTTIQEAIKYHRRAFDKRNTVLLFRGRLSTSYALLAAIERELGQIDAAVDANKTRRDLWLNDGGELYVAAGDFVRIGDVVKSDAAKQRLCYDLAVETLQWAVKAGLRNAEQVEKDPLLTPLRARKDFQKLLGEMKQPKR